MHFKIFSTKPPQNQQFTLKMKNRMRMKSVPAFWSVSPFFDKKGSYWKGFFVKSQFFVILLGKTYLI